MDDFNKQCAEALRWRLMKTGTPQIAFVMPEDVCRKNNMLFGTPKTMHFHDSEDWVALLIKEIQRRGLIDILHANHLDGSKVFNWLTFPPKVKAQACLEVLNG